ncbi:MAG: energy-coupling factor ABC transporter permease [Candidatus Rokuibacteriota bacterium]
MHIPDGFLDAKTLAVTTGLAAVGVTAAVRQARTQLPPRKVPLLGVTAAFVFAAQMVNFPVAGGTSGHLIGGVLAGVLLGPSGAVLVMTAVLTLQCLLFADGGLLALGANIFNMGIVGGVGGYYIYRTVSRAFGDRARFPAVPVAAWCGTIMSAVATAGQLSLSGVVPWSVGVLAMAGVHMVIGVGEALITTLVVLAIDRTRPEILADGPASLPLRGTGETVVFGFVISLGLGMFVSPIASTWPDGLEKVAGALGFLERAVKTPLLPVPIPDYALPGIASPGWATALAGGIGTTVVFLVVLAIARLIVLRRPSG